MASNIAKALQEGQAVTGSALFATGSILVAVVTLALCFRKGEPGSLYGFFYTLLVLFVVPLFTIYAGFQPAGPGPASAWLSAISVSMLLASRFRPNKIVMFLDAYSQKRVMWKRYMGDTPEYAEWSAELKAHRKCFLILLGLLPVLLVPTVALAIALE